MKPIHRHMQEEIIKGYSSLPLCVAVLGSSTTINKMNPDRIIMEIESGGWDDYINKDNPGPYGQPLLLTLLGSRKAKLIDKNEDIGPVASISSLAAALVKRGENPLSQDQSGRDCFDQAFAVGEVGLLSQWLPLLSNPIKNLSSRLITSEEVFRSSLPWLHQAARADNHEMVDFLLSAGLSADQENEHGETPLFWAKSSKMISTLLAGGASSLHRNHDNMDASVFWLAKRKLPQQVLSELRSALPLDRNEILPRATLVADFYSQAQTGGKGTLEPLLKKLNLQPADVDKDGFGPLGNLGSRLFDPSSSRSSLDRKRALSWAETICAHPVAKLASPRDLQSLWVGCCRFGGIEELQASLGILGSPHASHIEFWQGAVDRLATLEATGKPMDFVFAWNNAHHGLQDVIKSNPEDARELGVLMLSCLDRCFAGRGHANAINLAVLQEGLLDTMKTHPEWGLEAHSLAWQAALHVDQTSQSKGSPLISVNLIDHLLKSKTPYPDDMELRVNNALALCSDFERDQLSLLARFLIEELTPQSAGQSSRMRL